MSDETTADIESQPGGAHARVIPVPALVIVWSADEPRRVGEIGLAGRKRQDMVLGRGEGDGDANRIRFMVQRPGEVGRPRPIESKGVSRKQLRLTRDGDGLRVERVGRCRMAINGAWCDEGRLGPGDTLLLDKQVVLLCVSRPPLMAPTRSFPDEQRGPFGMADGIGIIGESVATWRLRERAAFCGKAQRHVLVHGPSGSGKELVGRAIHALSSRRDGRWVPRNAATMPEGLIDAELFGNRADYPNPGSPARAGLVGSADGGTLFLDEIGELPTALQSRLLRVMDEGEYQRLGDDAVRRSELRVVAATNRAVAELKFDMAARLTLHVETTGLNERREDIPLLIRHLVTQAATESPELAGRFVRDTDPAPEVAISPALVCALVRHDYTLNVRELDGLLWRAMSGSEGDILTKNDEVEAALSRPREAASDDEPARPPPTREQVAEALERAGGSQTKAAKSLGLSSRYAMYRLMKKYGLDGK